MSETPKLAVESDAVLILTIATPEVRGDTLATQLTDEFLAALQSVAARKVVVDCERVLFLASVGFRPLLALYQKVVKEAGGRIVLCNLNPFVTEVLRVTRFVDTGGGFPAPFEVQPDRKTAVLALLDS